MPLPPPNGTPVTDTPTAPAKSAAAPTGNKPKAAQFGPARGEDAVPVPTAFNAQQVDLLAVFGNLKAAIDSSIGDTEDFVAAFEGMTKAQFPGNKEGRVAYDVARIVKIIKQGADRLEGKSTGGRTSKVAQLQKQLEAMAALLSPEQKAQLGL